MVANESIVSLLPYASSTLVPIVTALFSLIKSAAGKKARILSRYIGIRKTIVDSGYSGVALTGVDEIIESEMQRLKKIYDKQSDRKIDPYGIAAVAIILVLEILITFWGVHWALAIPSSWPAFIRIILWSLLLLLIGFMILFIAIGAATSIFKKKESGPKNSTTGNHAK